MQEEAVQQMLHTIQHSSVKEVAALSLFAILGLLQAVIDASCTCSPNSKDHARSNAFTVAVYSGNAQLSA
jgi:hypothetical protein